MSSTAEQLDLDAGDELGFAAELARVISTLLVNRGLRPVDVCERLGLSRGTWYNHMRDGRWTAWQMAGLAEMFGVDVGALYAGGDEIIRAEVQNAKFLTEGEVVLFPTSYDGGGFEAVHDGEATASPPAPLALVPAQPS